MDETNQFENDEFFNAAAYFIGIGKPEDVPPVRDQKDTNWCAGYAATSALYTDVKRSAGKCLMGSVKQLYAELKAAEELKDVGLKAQPLKKYSTSFEELFDHVQKEGIVLEKKRKSIKKNLKKIRIKRYGWIVPNNENDHARVIDQLLKQPLAASVKSTPSFDKWKSKGIYTHDPSEYDERNPGHAVTIVGYGVEDDIPYYIILNSHGKQWGYKGFAKVAHSVIRAIVYPVETTYGAQADKSGGIPATN